MCFGVIPAGSHFLKKTPIMAIDDKQGFGIHFCCFIYTTKCFLEWLWGIRDPLSRYKVAESELLFQSSFLSVCGQKETAAANISANALITDSQQQSGWDANQSTQTQTHKQACMRVHTNKCPHSHTLTHTHTEDESVLWFILQSAFQKCCRTAVSCANRETFKGKHWMFASALNRSAQISSPCKEFTTVYLNLKVIIQYYLQNQTGISVRRWDIVVIIAKFYSCCSVAL